MPRIAPASPTTDTAATSQRGIDITAKYIDIRKIVSKHFGGSCAAAGIDVDDLVQDVLFKCHRCNRSPKSAYDPERAKFSKYIYMMASGQLCEMLHARRRHPLTDLDCPDLEDDRGDPESRLSDCDDAAAEALAGRDAPDAEDDDDQIVIAGTCGPVWGALGPAVAEIQRRQPDPRTRRPVASPPRATQSDWLRGSMANDSLSDLLTAAADNDTTKEVA